MNFKKLYLVIIAGVFLSASAVYLLLFSQENYEYTFSDSRVTDVEVYKSIGIDLSEYDILRAVILRKPVCTPCVYNIEEYFSIDDYIDDKVLDITFVIVDDNRDVGKYFDVINYKARYLLSETLNLSSEFLSKYENSIVYIDIFNSSIFYSFRVNSSSATPLELKEELLKTAAGKWAYYQ